MVLRVKRGNVLLQDEVEKLYSFRDHYIEQNSLEKAAQKTEDVKIEMGKTLEKVESSKGQLIYRLSVKLRLFLSIDQF